MVVTIKDMETPISCDCCKLIMDCSNGEDYCALTFNGVRHYTDRRAPECPLGEGYSKEEVVIMLNEVKTEMETGVRIPETCEYYEGINSGIMGSALVVQNKIDEITKE